MTASEHEKEPLVSVVICSHNGQAKLPSTLSALSREAEIFNRFEVILVDSASQGDLLESTTSQIAVSQMRKKGIRVEKVRVAEAGLTRARSAGVKAACARVVCFLDDDNEIHSDYLTNGLRCFEPDVVGVVVSRVAASFSAPPPMAVRRRQHLLAVNEGLGTQPIVWDSDVATCPTLGAGLWIRRDLFESIYDPEMHRTKLSDRVGRGLRSGGDIEMGIWAGRLNYRRMYAPDLIVSHHISVGRTRTSYFARLVLGIVRSELTLDALYGDAPRPMRVLRWARLPAYFLAAGLVSLTRGDPVREHIFIMAAELGRCLGPYRPGPDDPH